MTTSIHVPLISFGNNRFTQRLLSLFTTYVAAGLQEEVSDFDADLPCANDFEIRFVAVHDTTVRQ